MRLRRKLTIDNISRNDVLGIQGIDPFHEISKFPDVTRPAMPFEPVERVLSEGLGPQPVLFCHLLKMQHELCEIVKMLPERRHVQRNEVKAVIEVLAEK